jgi:microcystin degradation protein MlrC
MIDWPPFADADRSARFAEGTRVGVLLVQHEANSFAIRPTTLGDFVRHSGDAAAAALAGANSEFTGALAAVGRLGGVPVPLLYAHAMPGGPLSDEHFDLLVDEVAAAVSAAPEPLDALVLCLHGSLAALGGRSDAHLVAAARGAVGAGVPIALSLDLHANVTPELVADVRVVTGYRTNPHVDLADTGARVVHLLAAAMDGTLEPAVAVAACPALFADQALRLPDGLLGDVVAAALEALPPVVRGALVDVSVFPTQPWLDAPGIGFTTVAVAHADRSAADFAAEALTAAVWNRRAEFGVDRLFAPAEAVAVARRSGVRPFVLTEAADAPTAGAAGDNPALLAELVMHHRDLDALITIVDAAAVARCWSAGVGAEVVLAVGSSVDTRWAPPVECDGQVVRVGEGEYRLTGVGYHGMPVSMGRFAVVRCGRVQVLITETPAWSADPGTWRHAGLQAEECDLLAVRSCSDYLANFPAAAATSVVVDAPGSASPRLEHLPFRRCGRPPYPVDPAAVR